MKVKLLWVWTLFFAVHYGNCGTAAAPKEKKIQGKTAFVATQTSVQATGTTAVALASPTATSSPQQRSSLLGSQDCEQDDLDLLVQEQGTRQYLVLRPVRAGLGRLCRTSQAQATTERPSSQGKKQRQGTRIEGATSGAYEIGNEATGTYLPFGKWHTGSGDTSKFGRYRAWTGDRRGDYSLIYPNGTCPAEHYDYVRPCNQAREHDCPRSSRSRCSEADCQTPSGHPDCRAHGKSSEHCDSEQPTSKATEPAVEIDTTEVHLASTVVGFQSRNGEVHGHQTSGDQSQTGRNSLRDRPGQADSGLTATADPVPLIDCAETGSCRDGSPLASTYQDQQFNSAHGPAHLRPCSDPRDSGFCRGGGGVGQRGRFAQRYGDGKGQNYKSTFQNSTTYRSGYSELQQTKKTEAQDTKTAFWRRPCPMKGVPGRDDHGRSRKVNFDTLPMYAFYDQVSDDEFGLWQERDEETLALMQEPPKPRIVVKAWWSGLPHQAEPRRFLLFTEVIEMEFLTSHFAEVWKDQIESRDFAFQRLVMPTGSDTENAVHFLLYPAEVLPHSCPTLVAVHTDTPETGSTMRWSPWCFKGHCLQGWQILRELGLALSPTTRLVQNGRVFSPNSLITLPRGNVLEIHEVLEEIDTQALYQTSLTKTVQPLAASIGEPLRGDQLLGLDEADEDLIQTETLPHAGDLHLYGFNALPEGMMQPRTVVLPDRSMQGHNFIMFALLDGMIRLPRRDAQISSWTDYNIRQMIFETWREFQPRDIDAYLVVPQPDRLARDGCVLVLHLRAPHVQPAPNQALVLCEFIITNRFRPDDFAESQHFACLLTSPGNSGAWMTSALPEEQLARLEVGNRVTMVQNRPISNHLRTFLDDGMLVTFLVDHRAPRPDRLGVFSLQQDFFLRIEDIFTGRPPRQGVTLIMHGHQGAYLGGRAISLFRPTLSDPDALLDSILAAWPDRDATNLRVCGLRPGLRGFASDGSLEIHLLIIFSCSPNLRVGLVRRQADMDAWFTLELPHATTIGEIREACNVPDTFGLVNSGSISNPAHLELLWGFYLHLRETVTEHFRPSDESEQEEQSFLQQPPKPILLFDELNNFSEHPSAPVASRPHQLWCKDTAAVLQQLDAHRILPHFTEPHNFEWLEVSRGWTSATWLLDQPCDELIFYTDGSAGHHHGGAGIVLFARQGHYWHFGGYVGVHLAHCSNAHTAELAAMTVGLKWAIDEVKRNLFCGGSIPGICFRYDSTSAGKKILGEYGGDADGLLTSTGRNLHRILIQRFDAQVKGEHVFGHSGEAGNECANTVARWASEEGNAPMDNFLMALINGHHATPLDWAWLFWRADLAPFYKEGIFTFPQPELPEFGALPTSSTTTIEEDTKHVNFFFKVATANALTLKVTKQKEIDYGLQGITRLESLLRQCHDAEIHIIVFQESRLQRLCGQMNPFYHLHFAPATKQGHFGIVIGFSKQLPFAHTGATEEEKLPLYFQNEKITIVDSSPRWLILHLRQPWLQCILIGFHGPHTQSSQEEAQQWWRDLHRAIPHRYRELPRLALGDANGHLGDIPSEAVQTYQSELQDRNGELFHQYLLDNDLWIPSTFSQHQNGPGGTWRHWHGHLLRNDYVALPQTWKHLHVKTYVETKVDLTLKREDHLVAACEIGGYGVYNFSSTCRRPDKFHLPPEPSTKTSLHRIAQLCPWIPWEIHPAEHDQILTENLTANMRTSIPRAKKRPYKPSISDDTWQLILRKRRVRNQLQEASSVERRARLREAFAAWRFRQEDLGKEIAQALQHRHYLHFHFQQLGIQVSAAIQKDDNIFYEKLAEESKRATFEKDYKRIWHFVRRQLPKHKQRRAARNPLTLAVLDDQWLPHFQALEIGHTVTQEVLNRDYLERLSHQEVHAIPRTALPTLNQVEKTLRLAQPRKAAGPDGLQPEVLTFAASSLAPAIWDLFTKVFMTQSEPLQWKNGTMIPIHKKGREDLASQYRGILLSPVLGKRFHSLVRSQLMQQLQVCRSPGQLGGFAHGEVLFGSHSLRTAAHIASFQQKASVVLFLDLRHAFHHVLRELAVGQQGSNSFELEVILQHLHRDGVDIRGVLQWLRLPGVLQRLGAPDYLARLVDEIHRDTHFQLPTLPDITKTTRGSRPGSPIADSMFHTIMLDLHYEVERVIEEETDHVNTCRQLNMEPLPITWADDMALLLLASENELVIPLVQRITGRLSEVFQRRGFQLNLDMGKTGAVISYKGPDAPKHRKDLLAQTHPGCDIYQNGTLKKLHFSAVYTHLGTYFEMEGGLKAEIKRRIGLGTSAFQQLRRPIFANHKLKTEIRLQLFESLVASKMWFGSGTWGHIPPSLLNKLDSVTMAMIRTIVGAARGPETTVTDDEIRSTHLVPTARVRLGRDRLLYAGRLFEHGPAFLHQLLAREAELSPESWTHYLKEDLAWLQRVLPGDERWPRHWEDLLRYWQQGGHQWPQIIRKALRYHLRQESIMLDVQHWQMRCYHLWKQAGVSLTTDPFQKEATDASFPCKCGKSFTTFRGLKVHETRIHGYNAPEKALATSAQCPVCQRYFRTRTRMQQHLAYAPRDGGPNRCYETLRRLPASNFAFVEEDDDHGAHALFHRKHALPVEGPPGLGATQRHLDYDNCLDELIELEHKAKEEGWDVEPTEEQYAHWRSLFEVETSFWYGRFCDPVLPEGCLQSRWIALIMQHDEAPHHLGTTCLYIWGQLHLDELLELWPDPPVVKHIEEQYFQLMADLEIAQFRKKHNSLFARLRALREEPALPEHGHREVYRGPANDRERRRLQQPVQQVFEMQQQWRITFGRLRAGGFPTQFTIPLCSRPAQEPFYVLLHLFAGRRRATDWHAHLSRLAIQKGVRLVVLSLDTAIDGDLCNLHIRAVPWRHIMELLDRGYICGLLAGAPCETFSEARHPHRFWQT